MRLFPEPKLEPLQANPALQAALNQGLTGSPLPPPKTPIAIVALNPSGPPHPFAEHRGHEVHYSASLLKVAAMYAAFELRIAAINLIAELGLQPAEILPTLKAKFNPVIQAKRVSQLEGLADEYLLPKYDQIFTVEPAFNFSPGFWADLDSAISESKNPRAAACIKALGFGYITKAIAEAGFLNPNLLHSPAEADGIWLAGDYGYGFPPKKVPTVNDELAAQATSVRQMARLFALMHRGELIDDVSDRGMVDLLAKAVDKKHVWLGKDSAVTTHYKTLKSKIGVGPLKDNSLVGSEALIIERQSSPRLFVVVYQNLPLHQNPDSIFPISRLVSRVIAAFP